jgi:hypothetical protein
MINASYFSQVVFGSDVYKKGEWGNLFEDVE